MDKAIGLQSGDPRFDPSLRKPFFSLSYILPIFSFFAFFSHYDKIRQLWLYSHVYTAYGKLCIVVNMLQNAPNPLKNRDLCEITNTIFSFSDFRGLTSDFRRSKKFFLSIFFSYFLWKPSSKTIKNCSSNGGPRRGLWLLINLNLARILLLSKWPLFKLIIYWYVRICLTE